MKQQPFYLPVKNEVELFNTAINNNLPVMLKGPTGCGKTRFLEYMAHCYNRELITVACHEDLTASDLIGRYLLKGGETVWVDGPLTKAVREGSICYLDEIVEARKDTIVVIHPLTDHRRVLPVEKREELITASSGFALVVSYNPGYQTILKDLKQSTKQRFVVIEFDYPSADKEAEIVAIESEVDERLAKILVNVAVRTRSLKNRGLDEGASTRLIVYTATLIKQGISMKTAIDSAMLLPLTDDKIMLKSLREFVDSSLPGGGSGE